MSTLMLQMFLKWIQRCETHRSKHSAYEIAFPLPRLALLSHFLSPIPPPHFCFCFLSAHSHYLKCALSFLSHRESFQVAVEDKLSHAVCAQGKNGLPERPSALPDEERRVCDRKANILVSTPAQHIQKV